MLLILNKYFDKLIVVFDLLVYYKYNYTKLNVKKLILNNLDNYTIINWLYYYGWIMKL